VDYGDLELFARRIFVSPDGEPTAAAYETAKKYDCIFIDEYQDTNSVQDSVFSALARFVPRFMVGDVKQSIYRFRLAEPKLFLERALKYDRREAGEEHLVLQTNFRSRPEILETVNRVFRDIMRKETAEQDYTDQEALIPGRTAEGFHPVCVDVLEPDPERTKLESAADDVVQRIREMKEEGFRYREMVILMPQVSREGAGLAERLEQRGIPVFFDGGADFYEREEIAVFV
jgi:ATP-dependent helicase/nuclease subunit A